MERYEVNWRALQAERVSLVERAKTGDTDAMDALRTMALHAGVFACLSVHNTVHNQELMYRRWLEGQPITGLTYHVEGAEQVGKWIAAHLTLEMLAEGSGVPLVNSVYTNIKGLGSAKATYMGALLGFPDCICLDRWMWRIAEERGITRTKFVPRTLPSYRKVVERLGWNHTLDQWAAFMAVPSGGGKTVSFAETNHDCFFRAVLGDKAVTA